MTSIIIPKSVWYDSGCHFCMNFILTILQCVMMINIQYSCVVATSFVHRADIWSNLEEVMITYG